jgi:ABC-2 type transport system permease protein
MSESANNIHFSWRRLRALCRKETVQILRDPSSALIAVVIPLMLLFIFGYGINLDSSKLHVGILWNSNPKTPAIWQIPLLVPPISRLR